MGAGYKWAAETCDGNGGYLLHTLCQNCNLRKTAGRSGYAALRRRSAAARLLRLWVRFPPGAWMSVLSVVCCGEEVSATG